MRSIYKYVVASIVVLLSAQLASAQEMVTDQLVYDRVTGYMSSADRLDAPTKSGVNIQEIRWKHDISLWCGAPGLISEAMLVNLFGDHMDYMVRDNPVEHLVNLRTRLGVKYRFPTIGISYSNQLRPWLALGVKSTFAGIWQGVYDVCTDRHLYNEGVYNITAMVDARFSWLRLHNVEMYSSVAVGLCAHIEYCHGNLWPMCDVALVGLKIGRSFYGFVEIGAGVGGSVRGGLGVRFNGKK
jgi:hypothetical protein